MVRQHEEFVWLHDRFEENEEYAGYIVSSSKLFFYKQQAGHLPSISSPPTPLPAPLLFNG